MRAKSMVGMAVASALMWSYGAMANPDFSGERGAHEVVTPFSPNEAGPAMMPHEREAVSAAPTRMSSLQRDDYEIATPFSPNESGPADNLQQRGHALQPQRTARSMASPQTPWSPNETGANDYEADMHARARQVNDVEQARIAAAEWNASIAAAERNAIEQQQAASSGGEPSSYGSTSGLGLQGTTEGHGDPAQQSSLPGSAYSEPRSDNGNVPTETDRTHVMRSEPGYSDAGSDTGAVGILEVPAEPADQAVWNVEPLTPGANLASGATVYAVPPGHELVFLHDLSSGAGVHSDERTASAAQPSDNADTGGSTF